MTKTPICPLPAPHLREQFFWDLYAAGCTRGGMNSPITAIPYLIGRATEDNFTHVSVINRGRNTRRSIVFRTANETIDRIKTDNSVLLNSHRHLIHWARQTDDRGIS